MHPMCKHFVQRERREWVGGLALCPKESEWGGGEEVRRTPFSSAEKEELLACAFCKKEERRKRNTKQTKRKRRRKGVASKQRGKMGYGDMGEGAPEMGDNKTHNCHQDSYLEIKKNHKVQYLYF